MAEILSSVRSFDLVSILSEFVDEFSGAIAPAVGEASCRAGIMTLAAKSGTGTE